MRRPNSKVAARWLGFVCDRRRWQSVRHSDKCMQCGWGHEEWKYQMVEQKAY